MATYDITSVAEHIKVALPSTEQVMTYAQSFMEVFDNYNTVLINDATMLDSIDFLTALNTTKGDIAFIDTETYKYNVYEDNPLFDTYDSKGKPEKLVACRLIQIYLPSFNIDTVYVIDVDSVDLKDKVIDFASDNIVVYHNAAYDLRILKPKKLPYAIEDTLYLSRLAYPYADSKSLGDMIKLLGVYDKIYGDINKKATQKSNFASELSSSQIHYGAADVIATAYLFYNSRIQKARHKTVYKLDVYNQRYASIYQQNKMYTDKKLVMSGILDDEQMIAKLQQKMEDLGHGDVNVRSAPQTVALLQQYASDITSSDKQTLVELSNDGSTEYVRELADTIFKLRRALKSKGMLSKYKYGWVVSNYNVGGATTGRFTSSGENEYRGVNTQQIPRKRRDMFIPRDGNVIVGADYPTIELRAIAGIYPNLLNNLVKYNPLLLDNEKLAKYWWPANDVMYNKLKAGIDLHMATASSLSGLPVEEIDSEERFKAKAVNFGKAFGMGARAFQDYAYVSYDLKYTLAECTTIHNKYRETYPEIDRAIEYFIKAMSYLKRRQPLLVSTVFGRVTKPRRVTDGINNMVQGSAADVYKLAVHYLMQWTSGEALKYFIFPLHDAMYLDVPKVDAQYWKGMVKEAMEAAWFEAIKSKYFKYSDIPLEVDVGIYDRLPA
jgi:DNA polymerase I-like protein with 3'-5' exonuclease and polymerase domains